MTLVLGTLIILLSLTIEHILRFTQRWHGYGIFQRLEWISTETLQIQCMAQEELGFGSWERGTDGGIPVTKRGEQLAMLDVDNPKHPRLTRQSGSEEVKMDNKGNGEAEGSLASVGKENESLVPSPSDTVYGTGDTAVHDASDATVRGASDTTTGSITDAPQQRDGSPNEAMPTNQHRNGTAGGE